MRLSAFLGQGPDPRNEGRPLVGTDRPAGVQQVERMRGRPLKGVLTGSAKAVYDENDIISGEMANGKWVRQGNYKAIAVAPPYGSGVWQLYNVVDDPGETRDLAKTQPEKLKKMQAAWDQYAKDVGVVLTK